MDFSLNEEQKMFQTSTRRFLTSKGDTSLARDYSEGNEQILEELWSGLVDLGYMGITIPEIYGGLELGSSTLVPILEEMGRSVIPGLYPETVAFAVPLLMKYGSETQKSRYLPEIAAGKRKFTLALYESDGRFSAKSIQLPAKMENNEYVLQGSKTLVPHADIAETIIVPVRTDGKNSMDGISLLLIDTCQVNLKFEKLSNIDQTRKLMKVMFEDVHISNEQLLGPENKGWEVLQFGFNNLNTALCSIMVGGMERIVEMSTEYAKTRVQFGQPIGRFQAVKHKIVDMKLKLENARSLSFYAAWALEEKSDDLVESISLARAFINESYIKSAENNIQVHGGMGYTWEFDCHLYLKRALSLENHLGSPTYHREVAISELGC
ncbi:acyl-CoA dehydrogenase family protein [Sporosarcina sp. P33]|uniref:acyl-CoA dehydrogenase family protein n=1 Tax=Sporosarcina sp. P33 TaxID=1930764 RepID=UPI0009C00A2B|nr:acyl-CoA dehydrogenase family protein [Sporosarcina sp. P33]ARD47059.1 acyl-CoA dehydrogenase [Sporosarcina sp. P33]